MSDTGLDTFAHSLKAVLSLRKKVAANTHLELGSWVLRRTNEETCI